MDSETESENDFESNQETSDENDSLMWDNVIEAPPELDTDEFSNQTGLQDSKEGFDLEALMNKHNVPLYEDVTLMINSNIPFLIDGDALITYAFLQQNHEVKLGGQFLHIIYFCERFLHTLLDKGGNFIIVFFNVWKNYWHDVAYLKCLRLSVYTHLKKHTNYRLLKFESFLSRDFRNFLDIEKPRCVFLDIGFHLSLKEFNTRVSRNIICSTRDALLINCGEILFFRANDLPCIDICNINIEESIISSYNLHANPRYNVVAKKISTKLANILSVPLIKEENLIKCDYSAYDARQAFVIIAASKFLLNESNRNILKLIILSYAALEVLQLQHRCCPIFQFKDSLLDTTQDIIMKWLDCLSSSFEQCVEKKIKLSWDNVADMWQGTMFSYISYAVQNAIHTGAELGHLQKPYEDYIKLIECEANKKLEPYPIVPLCQPDDGILMKDDNNKDKVNLYLLNNALIRNFCGSTFQDVKWLQSEGTLLRDEFDEVTHWHCRKPLTDDFEKIRSDVFKVSAENKIKTFSPRSDEKWKQKQEAAYCRYLNIYGHNLEGRSIKSETIIYQSKASVKNAKKEKKKVTAMKEEIMNKKMKDLLIKEKEILGKLKSDLMTGNLEIDQKISVMNRELKKIQSREIIVSVKILMLEVYRRHIKKVAPNQISNDLKKDVFLVIKSILEDNLFDDETIDKKHKDFLSKFLNELGLEEIALRNNLPTCSKHHRVLNLDWIRFQLEYLGADMKRIGGEAYDPDVGFTPDPWQSKFINAIREKKSALVVAPTSSGKTFAAYYCMKRVLQESEDGVVVYVAPTKALVNQVEATVYARFKGAVLKDGKSVVGVFTRDYTRNALTARILVTVPQCLEILLLSPRRYTWAKNLKYAIFDEVHKLSGNIEGLVWERCLLLTRCPFLALSATISDVPKFHNWLVNNENFKKEQDRVANQMRNSYEVALVEYDQRHSDLIKYVYNVEDNLQHYHPYCSLDAKTLKEHNGIPSTIHLSPLEVLQLFDCMRTNESMRRKLSGDCNLPTFFSNVCKNGFITRNQVTQYEKLIAAAFYETHEENEDSSSYVINKLTPQNITSEQCDLSNVPSLLDTLAKENLLPCITFSYNRNLIECMNYVTTEKCEEEEIAEMDRKAKKEMKQEEKLAKQEKKMREKQEGSNKDLLIARPTKRSEILRMTGSKFKGKGIIDSESGDIKLIERRLARTNYSANFKNSLPYGIGYHHAGLNNVLRSTIEILFRMGILRVVFATGTLALGIHMPCKSVVIFGDSPFLNSLEFHQMSGRAGRRGFDTQGNVIFAGLTKKRQDMLMTDKLPKMIGTFPISVTLVARLLLLATRVTDRGQSSDQATDATMSKILALLDNSLIFQSKPNLKIQIKHFVEFAAQLLFIQGIYSADGIPLKLASIINHLHYHEPANFAFAYLFRSGALRRLIKSIDNSTDRKWALIVVISHLFAPLKLHKIQKEKKYKNSVVKLEPLPDIILQALENYNKEVEYVFNEYFINVANHLSHELGRDDTLPISKIKFKPLYSFEKQEESDTLSAKIKTACIKRVACSSFIALSGNNDNNLYTGTMISNIRHEICPGIKVIPLIETNAVYNSYAADFYRHGIVKSIRDDNGLKAGNEFTRLKDFYLVLKALVICLEELEPIEENDPVLENFRSTANAFEKEYRKAFFT